MLRIGIIGVGGMGNIRARAVRTRDDCRLTWIAGRKENLLKQRAEECNCRYCTDWQELVAAEDVDAVVICTPNASHHPMGMKALEAGKHVFMEYPLAVDLQQCDELIETAGTRGLILQCGQSARYEGPHLTIKEYLPRIEPVLSAFSAIELDYVWRWATRDEVMGDYFALANFHMVDHLINWLGRVTWVNATLDKVKDAEGNNLRLMGCQHLGFASGASAFVHYGMGIAGRHDDFVEYLQGEKGYLLSDGNVTHGYRDTGGQPQTEVMDPSTWEHLPHSQERDLGDFIDAVLYDKPATFGGEVARHPCEVAFASTKSARTGRRIQIPE